MNEIKKFEELIAVEVAQLGENDIDKYISDSWSKEDILKEIYECRSSLSSIGVSY